MNTEFFNHSLKIITDSPGYDKPENMPAVLSIMKELKDLGFVFSEELIFNLARTSLSSLILFRVTIISACSNLVGANVSHKPFYPNFPNGVMKASESELYFNALMHYIFGYRPEEKIDFRPYFNEKVKYKVIEFATEKDYWNLFTNIFSQSASMSPKDEKFIEAVMNKFPSQYPAYLPKDIPFKEHIAIGAKIEWEIGLPYFNFIKYVKTPTDVLRIAVGISGGDVSLATPSKFISFSRPTRRSFVKALDLVVTTLDIEPFQKHKAYFVRFFKSIHISEYQVNRSLKDMISALRSNDRFHTEAFYIDEAIKKGMTVHALGWLKKNPGNFVRSLDRICRDFTRYNQLDTVTESLREVIGSVSTRVLVQAWHHFKNRNKYTVMSYIPKASDSKMWVSDKKIDPMSLAAASRQIAERIEEELLRRFSTLPKMNMYIDPDLDNILVPFSQRTASKTLLSIPRGSRIEVAMNNTLRFFVYWRQGDVRVDIDLSCSIYDGNMKEIQTVAYYNLKGSGMYHSGDITSAPNGATEFLDVTLAKLPKGARYIAPIINSYNNVPFKEMPECFVGWMWREEAESGEIFEPQTVEEKFDVTSSEKMVMPVLFDLDTLEMVWLDMGVSKSGYGSNAFNSRGKTKKTLDAILAFNKPTLGALLRLHSAARANRDLPVTRFDLSFAKKTDEILSQFLM